MGCNNSGQQAVGFSVGHLLCAFLALATPWLTLVAESDVVVPIVGQTKYYSTLNYWLGGNSSTTWRDDGQNMQTEKGPYDWQYLYSTSDEFFKPLGQASAISITCVFFQLLLGLIAIGLTESSRFYVMGRCCRSTIPNREVCCFRETGRMPCGQDPIKAARRGNVLHGMLILINMASLISYPVLMRDAIKETKSTETQTLPGGGSVTSTIVRTLSAAFAFQVIGFTMLLAAKMNNSRWIDRAKEELQKKKYAAWDGPNARGVVEMNPVGYAVGSVPYGASQGTPFGAGYAAPGAAAMI